MGTIIPVDYCQANVVMGLLGDSEPVVCTFGLHCTDEGVITPGLANAVMTEWGAAFAAYLFTEYSIQQVVLYGFNGLGPSEVFVSTSAPIPGAATDNPLPQNCAYLIKKKTDAAGRRGRGRFFLPSVREDQVTAAGVIGAGMRANIQGAATQFLTGIQALPAVQDMVILHRTEGAGVEPAPTPVTALTLDSKIATQRRRLRP